MIDNAWYFANIWYKFYCTINLLNCNENKQSLSIVTDYKSSKINSLSSWQKTSSDHHSITKSFGSILFY